MFRPSQNSELKTHNLEQQIKDGEQNETYKRNETTSSEFDCSGLSY